MKRTFVAALLTAIALVPARAASDALTDVRAALGGDAALAQVTSIHAVGKIVLLNGTRDGTIEVFFKNPDRFVRITRTATNPAGAYTGASNRNGRLVDNRTPPEQEPRYGSVGAPDLTTDVTVTTTKTGFLGSTRITDGRGGRGGLPGTGSGPRQYATFAIPLGAQLTSAYPARVSTSPDIVHFQGDDGVDLVLTLDPTTHLPASLSWVNVGLTTSADTVITFSDFRKVDGVVWPFRIVTRLGPRPIEDVTIKKYEINKKIDDKVFR